MRHREHLATLAPVVGQRAANRRLRVVGIGQLLGGEMAELVEDAGMANRQPLRHLQVHHAGHQHLAGHEIDHLLQTALAKFGVFLDQQAIQQGQRCQQHLRGRLVLHFDQEGAHARLAAFTAARAGGIGPDREDVARQRGDRGVLGHGAIRTLT